MRLTLSAILSLLLVPSALAAPPQEAYETVKEEISDSAAKDAGPEETYFNGQAVPPMTDLSGETLKQDIRRGYW